MSEKWKERIFIFLLFSTIILYKSCNDYKNEQELKEHGKIIIGKASYHYFTKNSGTDLAYSYKLRGKQIKKSYDWNTISTKNSDLFELKYFPVIYLEDDIEVSRMLIFPKDFKQYNISFPDSLNWVKQYEK